MKPLRRLRGDHGADPVVCTFHARPERSSICLVVSNRAKLTVFSENFTICRLDVRNACREKNWERWGPYLSERQWATVREDYSAYGSCWDYFPHDHDRYFDVFAEYGKSPPNDILIRITIWNRGPEAARLHALAHEGAPQSSHKHKS